MRSKIISLMIVATALFAGSAAFADEVVIHHNRSDAIVPVPPPPGPHTVVVEHRSGDCRTTTVHKENDAGDSKTVRKTDCD
ncbi:MAG: hypothetical protein ACYC5H_17455 [Methylovirgula sp.]